jgi:hypothetical protein
VRATIKATLPQAQLLGLSTPVMLPALPLPLPSAEQVQCSIEQVREAAQPVLEETGRTLNGMATAVLENNGVPTELLREVVPAMVENQNTLGRGVGHGVSLLQAAVELEAGVGMMLGGGEALVTSPAAATGVGAVVPGAGVATVVAGAAVTTHGIAVGANTLNSIFFAKSSNIVSSGKSSPVDPLTLKNSANAPDGAGVTPAGRAFQKHLARGRSVTGVQTGNAAKNAEPRRGVN